MSSEIAIRAEGIGKRYRIGATQGIGRYRSLREDIAGLTSRQRAKEAERDFWALKDVSFEIRSGETVGIIGRNGAGKSTMLKILARITPPTSGRGETVGRVGSLLEVGTGFHPELTGQENIMLSAAIIGMRRSEVLALQWGDVDLDAGGIVVRRSITHTPASGIVFGLTKTGTKGHRVISLGASVVAEMKAHRADQEVAARSNKLPAPVWVFSHDAGASPWRPDYVTLKFNRLRKDLGLTHVRLHDLRHWAATSLLSEGTPAATVSKRLGHARTSTTLDKYAHWMPAQDQDAADSLDALLS